MKQSLIYFVALILMKTFVLFVLQILPWIALVGDWALRWTEGSEALQITFVMLIFPLVMNGFQYWIIDNFLMERAQNAGVQGHQERPEEDLDEDETRLRLDVSDDDDDDSALTEEAEVAKHRHMK